MHRGSVPRPQAASVCRTPPDAAAPRTSQTEYEISVVRRLDQVEDITTQPGGGRGVAASGSVRGALEGRARHAHGPVQWVLSYVREKENESAAGTRATPALFGTSLFLSLGRLLSSRFASQRYLIRHTAYGDTQYCVLQTLPPPPAQSAAAAGAAWPRTQGGAQGCPRALNPTQTLSSCSRVQAKRTRPNGKCPQTACT